MQYPYAYDKGGKLARTLGVSGIPHAFLVDPSGTVVWRGHPASLDDSILAEHTKGALTKPVWDWPKSLSKVKTAIVKRRFADALAAAEAADGGPQTEGIAAAIQGMIAGKVAALDADFAKGDYLNVQQGLKTLTKELAKLPEAQRVAEVGAKLAKAPQAKAVIKALRSIEKWRDAVGEKPLRKKKDARRLVAKLEKIRKRLPESYAAERAQQYADELAKLMPKLR